MAGHVGIAGAYAGSGNTVNGNGSGIPGTNGYDPYTPVPPQDSASPWANLGTKQGNGLYSGNEGFLGGQENGLGIPVYNPQGSTEGYSNSTYLPSNYFSDAGQNALQSADTPPAAPIPVGSAVQNSTPAGSTYPTMANSYGLGTQGTAPAASTATPSPTTSTASPGNPSSPDYATEQLASAVSDSGSRGFNPWSMIGESNSRSGQSPS